MYRFKYKPNFDMRVIAIVVFFSRTSIVNILALTGISKPILAILVTGLAYIFLLLSIILYKQTIILDGIVLIIGTFLFFSFTLEKFPHYYYLFYGSEYDIYDKVFNLYSMIFAYYFIRILPDWKLLEDTFKYIVIVTFLGMFWNYQGNAVDSGTSYNMLYGYTMSFCAIIFLWLFLNYSSKWGYALLSGISIILSATLGSRGPVLGYIIFLIAYFFIVDRPIITVKKLFFFFFSLLGILVIQSRDIIYSVYVFFRSLGFESRTILKLAEGTITEANGRDKIYFTMQQGINSMGLFDFMGAYGDRFLMNGRFYAHNIIYEIVITFGPFVGGIILILICLLFIKAIVNSKHNKIIQSLLIAVISYSLGRLWVSNSFWYEPYFGVALGLSISILLNMYKRRADRL